MNKPTDKRTFIQPLDVVMVFFNDFPQFWARINDIVPDQKKGWYVVSFTQLTMPIINQSWIIDENQLAGEEFTMDNGRVKVKLTLLPIPKSENANNQTKDEIAGSKTKTKKDGNLINANFKRDGFSKNDKNISDNDSKIDSNVVSIFKNKKQQSIKEPIEPEIA